MALAVLLESQADGALWRRCRQPRSWRSVMVYAKEAVSRRSRPSFQRASLESMCVFCVFW